MHAYIYFNIRKTPSLNKQKKKNMHAHIISMFRITLNMHKIVLLQMVPLRENSVFGGFLH